MQINPGFWLSINYALKGIYICLLDRVHHKSLNEIFEFVADSRSCHVIWNINLEAKSKLRVIGVCAGNSPGTAHKFINLRESTF